MEADITFKVLGQNVKKCCLIQTLCENNKQSPLTNKDTSSCTPKISAKIAWLALLPSSSWINVPIEMCTLLNTNTIQLYFSFLLTYKGEKTPCYTSEQFFC